MTLLDDVKRGYEITRESQDDGTGPVTVIRDGDAELAPGFVGMRAYYEQRLLAVCRRGYRHVAGSTLPEDSDGQLEITGEVMLTPMIATLIEAFTDGVMIGHEADQQVKISLHFNIVHLIFTDSDFRSRSNKMAAGFADDDDVLSFFTEFFTGGFHHLSHLTGFAHTPHVRPGKVWDLWMLIGTANTCSSYLAGYHMGQQWKERDVLDGITIATEEVPHESDRKA